MISLVPRHASQFKKQAQAAASAATITEHLLIHVHKMKLTQFKKELVTGFGDYVKFVKMEMEQAEQLNKIPPTGLTRGLIYIWYSAPSGTVGKH